MRVGRSGSSDGAEPELAVEDVSAVVEDVSVVGLLRVRVGRSGSSDGVVPVLDVVSVGVEAGLRRVRVGRSGSSAWVVLVVEVGVEVESVDGVVVVPEESRRFMVGRSESSLLVVVVVVPEDVAAGLLESSVGVVGFVVRWGWVESFDAVVMVDRVLEGLSWVVVLRGAARGFTVP